jgi:hypothetical protein
MIYDKIISDLSKYVTLVEAAGMPATAKMATITQEVVELHKRILWKNIDHDTQGYKCQSCEGYTYPCETIETIQKGLGL